MQYVHDTVIVFKLDEGTSALGSFGSREHINAKAWETTSTPKLGKRPWSLWKCVTPFLGLNHAPTEVVPTRQCAEASKPMYHTRINRDVLDPDVLAVNDGHLRSAVSASLWRLRLSHRSVCRPARFCQHPSCPLSPWRKWKSSSLHLDKGARREAALAACSKAQRTHRKIVRRHHSDMEGHHAR